MEPVTSLEILDAFDAFVARQEAHVGARRVSAGQMEGLHVAHVALEDIIVGRMGT